MGPTRVYLSRRGVLQGAATVGAAWLVGPTPVTAAPDRHWPAEGEVITSDAATIHYVDSGPPGPVILLVGGWTMTIPWWREQLAGLADDFRVVTIDPRAYGESEKVSYGHRLARHAADVRDVVDALHLREVSLVGWSLAANTVLAYLEQFGAHRLAGAAYVEMSPYPNIRPSYPLPEPGWDLGQGTLEQERAFLDAWRADPELVANQTVDLMFTDSVAPEDRDWMVREILKTPVSAAAEIEWDTFHTDWRATVPRIDVPMLVVSGRQSRLFPLEVGRWMATHLPNSRWHIFDHSGHVPHLEESAKFNALLADFASRHGHG